MASAKTRETPQEWSAFFAALTLPSPSSIGDRIQKLLRTSDTSYAHLAQEIQLDPVIAFKVMRAANVSANNTAEGSKTLDHAISMIGLDHLKTLTQPNPPATRILLPGYFTALSTSVLAAALARKIAERRKPAQVEDIKWAALFYGAPLWYLAQFAGDQMQQLHADITQDFAPAKAASERIFGCTLDEILRTLVRALDMPQLVRECWNGEHQPGPRDWIRLAHHVHTPLAQLQEQRDLSLKLNQPAFCVILANRLASYAMEDWYSRGTLRMQKAMAAYLGASLVDVIRMTHECAAEASSSHPFPLILLPAMRLFLPPALRQKREATAEALPAQTQTPAPMASTKTSEIPAPAVASPKPAEVVTTPPAATAAIETPKAAAADPVATEPAPKPPARAVAPNQTPRPDPITPASRPTIIKPVPVELPEAALRGNPDLFQELTGIMLNHPEEFADMHELMNAAVQGIAYGLGLKRVLALLVNTRQTRLKTYYHAGIRKKPELAGLEIDLGKVSIFNKLIEKAASIWVKPDSSKQIWNMIPASLKITAGAKEFFLMSIYVNNKPIAVFYADHWGGKGGMTEGDYRQFKHLCTATAQCLASMLINKTTRAAPANAQP